MLASYADVKFADKYFTAIGNTAWGITPKKNDSQHVDALKKKTAALIKATLWLDSVAAEKWKGCKTSASQELAWPRKEVKVDGVELASDVIPERVKFAVCEAAVRIIQNIDLEPDLERGGLIQREAIGNGAIDITYMNNAPPETRFSVIENLLAGLLDIPLFNTLKPIAGSVKIRRA